MLKGRGWCIILMWSSEGAPLIADEFGTTNDTLYQINGIQNDTQLIEGDPFDVPLKVNSSLKNGLNHTRLVPRRPRQSRQRVITADSLGGRNLVAVSKETEELLTKFPLPIRA
ncbi:hypothetical protein LINPERHAP2_LOCUS10690 [Linum perenne]